MSILIVQHIEPMWTDVHDTEYLAKVHKFFQMPNLPFERIYVTSQAGHSLDDLREVAGVECSRMFVEENCQKSFENLYDLLKALPNVITQRWDFEQVYEKYFAIEPDFQVPLYDWFSELKGQEVYLIGGAANACLAWLEKSLQSLGIVTCRINSLIYHESEV